jgi:hypothetical protein
MTDPNDVARPGDPDRIETVSIDPERIAALIDGKLSDAERAALMAELDASPEAFEVFADAVAALNDDDDESKPPAVAQAATVFPIASRRPRSRWYAGIGAIAAALIVIVGLPLLRGGASATNAQSLVALLDRPNEVVSLTAAAPWTELRGGDDGVAARARAIRIGARMVDLEVLLRSGDTAAAAGFARQIGAMLTGIPAGSVAAAAYRTIADSPTATAEARQTAASVAEQVAGAETVRLGAWLEAARMAAAAQDSAFFVNAPADRIDSAVPGLPQGSDASFDQLRRLLRAPSLDWASIQTKVASILREIAAPGA